MRLGLGVRSAVQQRTPTAGGGGGSVNAVQSRFTGTHGVAANDTPLAAVFEARDANGDPVVGYTPNVTVDVGYVSAALSSFALDVATIDGDGVDAALGTLTLVDTDGHPVPDFPATAITLTGTAGLNVTALSAATDRTGTLQYEVRSETAAVYTMGVTINGGALADTAELTVESVGGAAPVLVEDFSTYANTADLLADPRGIYLTFEDARTANMTLDDAVGYNGVPQSLRYDYPSGLDTDYTISRMLDMPVEVGTEVWIEAVLRFSPNFTIAGNGQPAGSALKMLHAEINGSAGRFAVNLEGSTARAEGPNDDYDNLYINPSPGVNVSALFDGAPHVIRHHIILGVTDFHEFSVDGVYQGSASGATAAFEFWGVALCRNLNKLGPEAMSLWWHRVRVYAANPNWPEFA